ncbi:MAG: MBL fold metallo-hydrolase [Saprospiraceae bacterium]|nr:MBL fold metallo-hydrolase [Saprospiraceae bacterium]
MKEFKLQFGGRIRDDMLKKYAESAHWSDGRFQNLEETDMSISFWDIPELICKQLTAKGTIPSHALKVEPLKMGELMRQNSPAQCVWYGHSALLMQIDGLTIMIDPMLGPDASPIGPIRTKRFSRNTLDIIDELPELDVVLITHDHYDHLDYESIKKLRTKTKEYFVALGVKRHLVEWGIDGNCIKEFDWWDQADLDTLQITFTPTRHFAGRGLTDRAKSFWGGWAFRWGQNNIWFSGDGGYGDHFKEIGARLGPFDFAFMECGQYNEKWHPIHMFPEESVQAAKDAGASRAMPVHWGGFSLSQHRWQEPAEEFYHHAQANELEVILPPLGVVFDYENAPDHPWWRD